MKKIKLLTILILISLFFGSCGDEPRPSAQSASTTTADDTGGDDGTGDDDDDEVVVVVEDPTSDTKLASAFTPTFILTAAGNSYLSDGISTVLWHHGEIKRAGAREFLINNELIMTDDHGAATSTTTPVNAITKLKLTENGLYSCLTYDPDTAYEMGGQRKPYTEFFKDGSQIGDPWYFNQFECAGIRGAQDNIFAIDQNGAYHPIESIHAQVSHTEDNRFFMHDTDIYDNTIGFNGVTESFLNNYVINSREWILFDGTEYGETGATWEHETGLIEFATAMQEFNAAPYPIDPPNPFGESPVLLKAGQNDGTLYWIECNSGWLFGYDPSTDILNQSWRLYLGDGLRITGTKKHDVLNPLITGGKLYFSNDGSINRVNLADGFIDVFYAGGGEVMGW